LYAICVALASNTALPAAPSVLPPNTARSLRKLTDAEAHYVSFSHLVNLKLWLFSHAQSFLSSMFSSAALYEDAAREPLLACIQFYAASRTALANAHVAGQLTPDPVPATQILALTERAEVGEAMLRESEACDLTPLVKVVVLELRATASMLVLSHAIDSLE
jgi:hypothetical protein